MAGPRRRTGLLLAALAGRPARRSGAGRRRLDPIRAGRSRSSSPRRPPTAGNRAVTKSGCCGATAASSRASRRHGATKPCCGSTTPTTLRSGRSKVIAYLEGRVVVETVRAGKPAKLTDKTWLGRFFTTGPVEVHAGVVAGRPDVLPAVYQRGMERRNPAAGADVVRRAGVEQAQYSASPRPPPLPRSSTSSTSPTTPNPRRRRLPPDWHHRRTTGRPGRGHAPAAGHAARPRLSPRRRPRPGPVDPRAANQPVGGDHPVGRELHRRRRMDQLRLRRRSRPTAW